MSSRPLRIAISAALSRPYAERVEARGKTLHYASENLSRWIMADGNALAFLIPASSRAALTEYARHADALILQGGTDVGLDPERDEFELGLLEEFMAARKPVLGICRGMQLINVSRGGTLISDLPTVIGSQQHREGDRYDDHSHGIRLLPDSRLALLYPGVTTARVNSLHHQAVARLGTGLRIEAIAEEDAVIEAIRLDDPSIYVFGTQWHPELKEHLDSGPLRADFLSAARGLENAGAGTRNPAPFAERDRSRSASLP